MKTIKEYVTLFDHYTEKELKREHSQARAFSSSSNIYEKEKANRILTAIAIVTLEKERESWKVG